MPVLPKRAILWAFVTAVIVVAVAGFSGEATAQVFQGPLDFDSLPPVTMTVTLHPTGPATYTMSFQGQVFDAGILVASVQGSSVAGFFQTYDPGYRQCNFRGTLAGDTATLILDAPSCGEGGTLVLTRIA
jgi:hypothetical protein